MEKFPEKFYQPEAGHGAATGHHTFNIERLHAGALEGESWEDASAALKEVEALWGFREKLREVPFGSFNDFVEEMTNLNKLSLPKEEIARQIGVMAEALEQKAVRFSPRVADLYLAMLYEIKGGEYEPRFEITSGKMKELKESGDLRVLFSPAFSWEMKLNRIETRLTDYLSGARSLDKREGQKMDDDVRKWRAEQLKKRP